MNENVEVFVADPIDENGKVIATVTCSEFSTPWGPVRATKVPHSEIVLDPENTINVELEDKP